MRLPYADPFLGLDSSYLVDSAQPSSISYAGNSGSLLATLLVASALAGALLAALAAFLAVRVGLGVSLRAVSRLLLWAALWGLLTALCLVPALGVAFVADPFLAAYPLSCLWGLGVVGRLLRGGDWGPLWPSTLAEAVARSPLAEATVASFLWYLPPVLGGTYPCFWDHRLEGPAGGSGAPAAPTSSFLGINTWLPDSFRRDTGLRLHAVAFASLLLSAPGLLLGFLCSLPWKTVSKSRVSLSLLFAFAPLALVLELLFSYAGHPGIRFAVRGGTRLTLVVRVDALRNVVRLATGASPGSNWELANLLTRTGGGPRGRVRADFYRSPVPPFPGRSPGPGRRG
jgi:hypothetical protein